MKRLEQLQEIVKSIDANNAAVIEPLLMDIVFMEERLAALRKLPHLRVSSKNPERQQITAAGKQYKETMQAYLNAIKAVETMLYRSGENAESPLLKALAEFDNA